MQIELNRVSGKFHFEAKNEDGIIVNLDGGKAAGGTDDYFRPMQMVLASVAGCSSIDVVLILEKMKQKLEDIKVEATGNREEDAVPKVFTDIHLHYKLTGDLDTKKVERAIALSMDKYCSVGMMLKAGGVELSYTFEINASE